MILKLAECFHNMLKWKPNVWLMETVLCPLGDVMR